RVTLPALPLIDINWEGQLDIVTSWISSRVHDKATMFGRSAAELVSISFHQGNPWPSITPKPLISTSCRLEPLMKSCRLLTVPGYWSIGSISNVAPASIWRFRLFASVNGPLRKMPAGISTVPIPPELAELIAFWMAVVLVATPSPTAPNAVILLVPGGMV